ncbi:MAG: 16S rRNA (cytidine(1402)-2'-O)-methyltransferase [Candidatus Zixiibacteriota bacterium]|nr:MAG: 16S rRNA (cytidine(1402)-2'-O)-methyltransferase [candidate division Zixibacteria bacterium]
MTTKPGKIYLVPTPIGNLGDITHRAEEVLSQVELVACEDTRKSGNLLKKLGLKKRLISYHDFNESRRAAQLLDIVQKGQDVAVITDAGSPGISDPAYRVVRTAIDNNIELIPLPGPSAIIPALTASGLPTDRFFFEGFLSNKSVARKRRLSQLVELSHTIVLYESPHRIHKTLADVLEILGDRQVCLSREISKKFEQHIRGDVSLILEQIRDRTVKGELVLTIAGYGITSKKERDER